MIGNDNHTVVPTGTSCRHAPAPSHYFVAARTRLERFEQAIFIFMFMHIYIYIYAQSLQWVCSSPRPFKGQQYRRFTAVPVPTLHICFRWTGLRRITRACKGAVLLEVSAQALCREMMRVLIQRSQGTGTMREQWLLLLPLHQSILLFKDIEAALRAEPQKVRS